MDEIFALIHLCYMDYGTGFIIPTDQFANCGVFFFVLVPIIFQNWNEKWSLELSGPFYWSHFTVWLKEAGILSIFNIRLKYSQFVMLF